MIYRAVIGMVLFAILCVYVEPSTSLLLILAMALGVRLFFLALEREKRIINVQGGVYSYIEVAQRVKLKIPVFEKKS
jgi:hypothetical protein